MPPQAETRGFGRAPTRNTLRFPSSHGHRGSRKAGSADATTMTMIANRTRERRKPSLRHGYGRKRNPTALRSPPALRARTRPAVGVQVASTSYSTDGAEGAHSVRTWPLRVANASIRESPNVARARPSRPALAGPGRARPEPRTADRLVGPAGLED